MRQKETKPIFSWPLSQSAMHDKSGKSRRIWYGRRKELWTKGAAGSVDQQAVERHW